MTRVDRVIAQRVLRKVRWLADHFDDVTPEASTDPWRGAFKLRVGDYRAIYTVDQDKAIITVHLVGHRREVYKSR